MLKQKKFINNCPSSPINPLFIDPLTKEVEDCLVEFWATSERKKTVSSSTVKQSEQVREGGTEPVGLSTSMFSKEVGSQSGSTLADSNSDIVTASASIASSGTSYLSVRERKESGPYLSLIEKLRGIEDYRKRSELIVGCKQNKEEKKIGFRLFNDIDKNESKIRTSLESTAAYSYLNMNFSKHSTVTSSRRFGATDFAISYDNQIFIAQSDFQSSDSRFTMRNHLTIGYGTFLKAVGLIQIEEGQIKYISSFSSLFETKPNDIIVVLTVFEKAGFDLRNTKIIIPDKKSPFVCDEPGNEKCKLVLRGWTRSFRDYAMSEAPGLLDVQCFPRAKARVEDTSLLTIVREIFLGIDDDLLRSHHLQVFLQSQVARQELKGLIVNLIKESEPYACFSRYNLISKKLTLLEKKANFNLTKRNLYNLLLWRLQGGKLADGQKQEIEGWFSSPDQKEVPSRIVIESKGTSYFLGFYNDGPKAAFIALLHDYVKDTGFLGWLKRAFYGAWNRHYVKVVTRFLVAYHQNEYLLDDLTICDTWDIIKGHASMEFLDIGKGTLMERALFCAALNNEADRFRELFHTVNDTASSSITTPKIAVVEEETQKRASNNAGSSSETLVILVEEKDDNSTEETKTCSDPQTGNVAISNCSYALFGPKELGSQGRKSSSFNDLSPNTEKESSSKAAHEVGLARSLSSSCH